MHDDYYARKERIALARRLFTANGATDAQIRRELGPKPLQPPEWADDAPPAAIIRDEPATLARVIAERRTPRPARRPPTPFLPPRRRRRRHKRH